MGDGCLIKTKVNLREFEKCAADRTPVGTINKEVGTQITRMGMDGKMQTIDANAGDKIYKGDVLTTDKGGSFSMTLSDKTLLSAGSESKVDMSKFTLREPDQEGDEIKRGSISVISGKRAQAVPGENVNWNYSSHSGGVRG